MIKRIIVFVLLMFTAAIVIYIGILYLLVFIVGLIFSDSCYYKKLESVKSPNGQYEVITYRKNCGATTAFAVTGKLCAKDNKCKEIYDCYREADSFVYWIDNETVFINNKILNIKKDKYSWKKDPNYDTKRYIKEQIN